MYPEETYPEPHLLTRKNMHIGAPTVAERCLTAAAFILICICPLIFIFSFKVVEQYKRAIILRLGKIKPSCPCGPGLIFVHPLIDQIHTFDIRTRPINVHPQEVLTRDSVTVTVEAVVYYHVTDPIMCLMNIRYFPFATEMLSISILRNVIGQYTLTDLLSNRELINNTLKDDIDKGTVTFGVQVERVEMKDIVLPMELQKAMAAEAEGRRLAKAKIITAEGEIQAAENLREASQLIAQNPKVMLLRYLQTLNFIATEQKTSVIFPFPVEIPEV